MLNNGLFTKEELPQIISSTETFLNKHLSNYNKAIKQVVCQTNLSDHMIDDFKRDDSITFRKYISQLLKNGKNKDLDELIEAHTNYHKSVCELLLRYYKKSKINEELFNNLYYNHNRVINSLNSIINKFEFAKNQIDDLTSAWSREMFLSMVTHEYNKSKRTLSDFALVFFDIDHFKKVNDTYGHAAGDYILKNLILLTKETLRDYDIIGRWGGEEFVLLLPQTKLEEAFLVINRLKDEIEKEDFIFDKTLIKVTCSFGIAKFDFDTSIEDTIKHADELMYQAKTTGRNKVVVTTLF